jgi:ABC-type multidrug transport system fused ATPase/permease subunit
VNYLTYMGMFILAKTIDLCEPYLVGLLLNGIQQAPSAAALPGVIMHYSLLIFATHWGFWLLHFPGRVIDLRTAFRIRRNYRRFLFGQALAKPLTWHQDYTTGETIDRINRSSGGLHAFLSSAVSVFYGITEFVVVLSAIALLDPLSGVTCLAASIAIFSVISLFDKVLNQDYAQLNSFENKISSAIHDFSSVVALRIQPRVSSEFEKRLSSPEKLFDAHVVRHESKWFAMSLGGSLLMLSVPLWYAYRQAHGEGVLLVGTFFTLYAYVTRLRGVFFSFSMLYGSVLRNAQDLKNAANLVGSDLEDLDDQDPSVNHIPWSRVEVRNLNFTYPRSEQEGRTLEDLSFSLHRGEKVAFIGESGSGKSTLLALFAGSIEGAEARVYIDDAHQMRGLREIQMRSAIIPQSPEIFVDTIRFNITFGIEASDQDLYEACDQARFREVVDRLPRGLDTHIAEKGVNLSGGERQRLALARGIFLARDSEILILDESTSSVDPVNEQEIYRNIWNSLGGRTVIAALHRMHLLHLFDHIYVLSAGKVVEHGSLEELRGRGGVFDRLYDAHKHQSE